MRVRVRARVRMLACEHVASHAAASLIDYSDSLSLIQQMQESHKLWNAFICPQSAAVNTFMPGLMCWCFCQCVFQLFYDCPREQGHSSLSSVELALPGLLCVFCLMFSVSVASSSACLICARPRARKTAAGAGPQLGTFALHKIQSSARKLRKRQLNPTSSVAKHGAFSW